MTQRNMVEYPAARGGVVYFTVCCERFTTVKGFYLLGRGRIAFERSDRKDARYKIQDARENLSNHSESCILNRASLYLMIGPEGGFSKEEINLAVSKGLIAASLGKRILRAETAAISAVALIQFLLGDI